jgi:hypothetical protein
MPDKETIIAALLRELAGFKAAGDEVNVKGVEAELKFYGYKAAAPAERAETRPVKATEKR